GANQGDEGLDQPLNEKPAAAAASVDQLRKKINSSIVVGGKMVLNTRQKLTRTRLFNLEMSEAKGGMIFDYDESSMILGLLCRIHDSRQIQGEERPTLIVVQSEEKFEKWTEAARNFSLNNVLVYHGRKRSPAAPFDRYQIILTTYRTLSGDLVPAKRGLLWEGFEFLRIILDGGEVIRNETTHQSQACRQVKASYHWCCTQNSQAIALHQYEVFARFLCISDLNATRRRKEFLEQFVLRDVDNELVPATPTSELENRFLIFQKVTFNRNQREFYRALQERLDEVGVQHLRPRAPQRNGTEVARRLVLLSLKACCHLDLVLRNSGTTDDGTGACGACNICGERIEGRGNSRSCTGCNERVVSKFPQGLSPRANSKIREMLSILRRTAKLSGGRGKTVIVCQFGSFADIIAEQLNREGIRFARFYDLNVAEKNAAMRRTDTNVALATVNPANIHGLDLRRIGTVILMDLWWNPRLDGRAFLNDHNVKVHIYKLYFENSVESRALELLKRQEHVDDCDQEIIHRLGIHSTAYNLDFMLQPT
ncbi:hypothetical protein FRC01_006282, partial [Tulasnella sp. 417]